MCKFINLKISSFSQKTFVKIMEPVVGNSNISSIFPPSNLPEKSSKFMILNYFPTRRHNTELQPHELDNSHMALDLSNSSLIKRKNSTKIVENATQIAENSADRGTNLNIDKINAAVKNSLTSEANTSFVLKPPHSYIGLIAMAILSCAEHRKTLAEIYEWIADNYPYFRWRGTGWRNSIRHNLSLNDCFVKINRASNGKGHYWTIHPANLHDFMNGDFRRKQAQWKVKSHFVFGQTVLAAFATVSASNNVAALQTSINGMNTSTEKLNENETSFRSIESIIMK